MNRRGIPELVEGVRLRMQDTPEAKAALSELAERLEAAERVVETLREAISHIGPCRAVLQGSSRNAERKCEYDAHAKLTAVLKETAQPKLSDSPFPSPPLEDEEPGLFGL